jgi:hypothetical protein
MNNQSSFKAPSVTRMKTCNWDNIGGVHKKVKRNMFVSALRNYAKNIPEVNVIRHAIAQKQAEKVTVQKLRVINQALGGGTCGKVKFCANGALQVKGKFTKNPLVSVA